MCYQLLDNLPERSKEIFSVHQVIFKGAIIRYLNFAISGVLKNSQFTQFSGFGKNQAAIPTVQSPVPLLLSITEVFLNSRVFMLMSRVK